MLPVCLAFDSETFIACDGDLETQIGCVGDLENYYGIMEINGSITYITIINPVFEEDEKTQPVEFIINLSRAGTCNMNVDGTNISMTTVDDILFRYSKVVDIGLSTVIFYCNDTIDGSANATTSFYMYPTSESGGGGVPSVGIEEVLGNISVTYEKLYIGEENLIYINVYNKTGELIDIDDLIIELNTSYFKNIVKESDGVYNATFRVTSNETDIRLKIAAILNDEWLMKELDIKLEKKTIIKEISEYTKKSISKLQRLYEYKPMKILFWILLALYIIWTYHEWSHRKSKI